MPRQVIQRVLNGNIFNLFNRNIIRSYYKPTFSNLSSSFFDRRPIVSPILNNLIQLRFASRGTDYQPSTIKRKRTFGFLARLRSRTGRKIIKRRVKKGRKNISH